MTAPKFTRATKAQARARVALVGPSGSGKTYTALAIAEGLGGRVAVVDTERSSASKYADRWTFDALDLDEHSPRTYVEAIEAAGAAGYDVLVVDSLSHAWMGRGGALEMVDRAAARSRSGNSFAAWREVTPEHHKLVDALLRSPCHVIATMRVRTEWVIEEDAKGKKLPRKIGLAPVQRDGLEYEFDLVADLDAGNLVVTKSRCSALADAVLSRPGRELGEQLRAWLTDGAPPEEWRVLAEKMPRARTEAELKAIAAELAALGLSAGHPGRGECRAAYHDAWVRLGLGADAPKPAPPPAPAAKEWDPDNDPKQEATT